MAKIKNFLTQFKGKIKFKILVIYKKALKNIFIIKKKI